MKIVIGLLIILCFTNKQLIAQKDITDLDPKLWEQANDIAKRITIIDCHSHSLFSTTPATEANPKQITYQMLVRSGVKGIVQSFPVHFDKTITISDRILDGIKSVRNRINDESLKVSIIKKSSDILKLQKKDSIGIMIAIESFEGLCMGDINLISKYYNEGVRVIGFYNRKLDSLYDYKNLTNLGNRYINEMNRLGIICDITHVPDVIRGKVIDESQSPVILSHANAYSLVQVGNNVSDSTLRKLIRKKGMICVSFNSTQISKEVANNIVKEHDRTKWPRANIEELIDQIDYLKNFDGIDYIGIGSDYGGSGRYAPKGLETVEGFPLIIYHMLKRGYSQEEIEKVMGLNFIRFFERVESKSFIYKSN